LDLGLRGKRALVLGGSRGLGRGIAEALATEGAIVALTGRKPEDAQLVASKIGKAHNGELHGLAFDAAGPESAALLAAEVRKAIGEPDILLLNGGGPPPGPITAVSSDVWRRQFQAQFLSYVELAGAVLEGMRSRGWGRILLSSSSGAVQPIPNLGISNSLRGSLLGWAKTLAAEVAADGVTVNTLIPGRIQTARLDEIDADTARRSGRTVEEVKASSRATIPAGRFGTVEEYASVAVFLMSEGAGYITGSTIRVDGGMIRAV
jgi:3-oxoacyl-[acyl-carrier protein] reductase